MMPTLLPKVHIEHIAAKPAEGDAAFRVLTNESFLTAREEITTWDGYAPTPLVSLSAIAAEICVGEVLYKDEGPRFGLGSFKALGGSYAALRVLQREISRRLGKDVSLADVRNGAYAEDCAKITLVSATDGNHGRSLAWGCKRFGAPCRIYIHAEVSEGRAAAMRDLGAEVIRIDGDYDESVLLAKSEAEKKRLVRGLRHVLARLFAASTRRDEWLWRHGARDLRHAGSGADPRIFAGRGWWVGSRRDCSAAPVLG
jgi:diaminopropionate ammonia-lyase